MSYASIQRHLAVAWKQRTDTLPDAARAAAPYIGKDGRSRGPAYDFCLPLPFATHNLLPEVRDDALALFAELGIPWHAGVDGGPSNHLLSSQVQCVNALGQMVNDPSRIRLAFGVGEVLEIEPGRYLTFEYIGPTDFFGEAPGLERVRGAHCTSVDAAFLHRLPDGRRELVLVEWKYTESYKKRQPEPQRDRVRRKRYLEAVMDPDGPIDGSLLPFELLLDEPIYQLVRQQLLAHALEKAGVAYVVRVVHVLSPLNREYQRSLHRPQQLAVADTVTDLWRRILRRPDRFATMNPEVFLRPSVTSAEYVDRYQDPVIRDLDALMSHLEVDDPEDREDALLSHYGWEEDVEIVPEGLVLRQGTVGTGLLYPFHIDEISELVEDLEP